MNESRYVFCVDCKIMVDTVFVDEGVGSYEFWGSCGSDSQWCEVCPSCENQNLLNEAPEEEEFTTFTTDKNNPTFPYFSDQNILGLIQQIKNGNSSLEILAAVCELVPGALNAAEQSQKTFSQTLYELGQI